MKAPFFQILALVLSSLFFVHATPLPPPAPLSRPLALSRQESNTNVVGAALNLSHLQGGISRRFGEEEGLPIRVMEGNAEGTHPKAFPYANYEQDVANLVGNGDGPAGGQQV